MPGRFANLEFEDERRRQTTDKRPQAKSRAQGAGDYLSRAREEYRWGQFEPALRLFTKALQEQRTLIPAWVGQVQMLVELGECHEARVWSDKALELFRNHGELLAAKSQACIRLRDKPAAMECSDASLQAAGSSAWRWQVRGELLLSRGSRQHEECFQKALAEPGADWFDRVLISRIYQYYHRFTSALQFAQAALAEQPTNGYVWLQLGHCQAGLGLAQAAADSYERCLEMKPGWPEAEAAMQRAVARGPSRWIRSLIRRWRR